MVFSKDKYDGNVRNYNQVSYIDNCSDGNYIYRLFEIGSFFKNRKKIKTVMELMGVESISIYPDKIEVKNLVERGMSFIADAEAICSTKKTHLSIQNATLDKIRNGDCERGSIFSLKEQVQQQQHKAHIAQSDLDKAEFDLRCHKGLLGMLRPVVKHMMDVDKVKMPIGIIDKIPDESIPCVAYENGGPFSAMVYKISREFIDEFINSVDFIYNVCNPVSDIHTMNSGWKFRYLRCRDYYRKDNELLRKIASLNEYAEFMTNLDMEKESKHKFIGI
ncbi:MAG: hypothetical protein QM578_11080 [Pantoea sp.]|uniref:hypothetical protein n=1 Tax=Pantoea sp. TaxID=69393 RepID=UPI0039E54372